MLQKQLEVEITFIPRRKFEVEAHIADMKKTEQILNWKYKTEILEWVKKFSRNKKMIKRKKCRMCESTNLKF